MHIAIKWGKRPGNAHGGAPGVMGKILNLRRINSPRQLAWAMLAFARPDTLPLQKL